MRARLSLAIAALVLAAAAPAAFARGVVLDIGEDGIYVDLGTDDGVAVGSDLTLHHVIHVTHPVTQKRVRDTFPLGTLEVVETGARIAVARAPAELAARVAVGDEVTLASNPVSPRDPWLERGRRAGQSELERARAEREAAIAAARRTIDEAEAVRATWTATLGLPLAERLAIWRDFLEARADTPYAAAITAEITELERHIADEAARLAIPLEDRVAFAAFERLAEIAPPLPLEAPLVHTRPTRAYEASPVPLAFAVTRPSAVRRAWLYFRGPGDAGYQRVELSPAGDGALRATIPASVVAPPSVAYFVEVLGDGATEPAAAIGSASAPARVAVDASVEPAPPDRDGRSRVTLFLDYVDFDGPSGDKDQYVHGEVDFLYRFFQPVYSLRLGFGTMGGVGGPKDVIDEHPDCTAEGTYMCRRVGYNYAFAEIEERLSPWVALMLRAQWGSVYRDRLPEKGADREFYSAFGVRGRVRFGSELGSNLVLGAAATRRIGKLYEAAFTWDVVPRFPMVFAVHVTDQPVVEDYGVRLLADVGWRQLGWMYPSVRVAYQARDIDHAGLSAGVAVNFDW